MKKQTRGLHTTAWLGDGGQRVVFVDENYNHRVYKNVSPSSLKRVLKIMVSFVDGGQAK
jgi:hypothetical protein